jgi:hypothetical protein
MKQWFAASKANAIVQTRLILSVNPLEQHVPRHWIGVSFKVTLSGRFLDATLFGDAPSMGTIAEMAA